MKLVMSPMSREHAARNLEAFAQRVRCGLVKRYGIVSLECSESDSTEQDFFVQNYRDGTVSLIEELAFASALSLLKNTVTRDLNCDEDDDD